MDRDVIAILKNSVQAADAVSHETKRLRVFAEMTDCYIQKQALAEACRWKWKRLKYIQKGD